MKSAEEIEETQEEAEALGLTLEAYNKKRTMEKVLERNRECYDEAYACMHDEHPELIGAYMQAMAINYAAVTLEKAIECACGGLEAVLEEVIVAFDQATEIQIAKK